MSRTQTVAVIVGLLCLGFALGSTGCTSRAPESFSAAQWKRHRTVAMADDLERRGLLASMTVDQVVATLGEPSSDLEPAVGLIGSKPDDPNADGRIVFELPWFWYLEVNIEDGRAVDASVVEP